MGEVNPRLDLGLSLDDAAHAIGISRGTLTKYELSPMAVGEALRRRIAAFYRDLAATRERARKRAEPEGKPPS